jgi:hypothetical protein
MNHVKKKEKALFDLKFLEIYVFLNHKYRRFLPACELIIAYANRIMSFALSLFILYVIIECLSLFFLSLFYKMSNTHRYRSMRERRRRFYDVRDASS